MGRTLSRGQVAERKGFEPSRRFPAYTLSRRAPSTTRPPLRWRVYPLDAGEFKRGLRDLCQEIEARRAVPVEHTDHSRKYLLILPFDPAAYVILRQFDGHRLGRQTSTTRALHDPTCKAMARFRASLSARQRKRCPWAIQTHRRCAFAYQCRAGGPVRDARQGGRELQRSTSLLRHARSEQPLCLTVQMHIDATVTGALFLNLADAQGADLTRRRDVGTAARLQV